MTLSSTRSIITTTSTTGIKVGKKQIQQHWTTMVSYLQYLSSINRSKFVSLSISSSSRLFSILSSNNDMFNRTTSSPDRLVLLLSSIFGQATIFSGSTKCIGMGTNKNCHYPIRYQSTSNTLTVSHVRSLSAISNAAVAAVCEDDDDLVVSEGHISRTYKNNKVYDQIDNIHVHVHQTQQQEQQKQHQNQQVPRYVTRKRPRLDELRKILLVDQLQYRTTKQHFQQIQQQTQKQKQQQQQQQQQQKQQHSPAQVRHDQVTTTTTVTEEMKLKQWKSSMERMIQQLPDPPEPVQEQVNNDSTSISKTNILLDQHNRMHNYLRISLTEKCNLRCQYCMPEDGVPIQANDKLLSTNEILQLAQYFTKWGVTKFRLTGGEPTIRSDIIDIVKGLATLQESIFHMKRNIGITTNGITLHRLVHDLINAGLTSINISLDTLQPDKFAYLTRRPSSYFHAVWKSIDTAVQHVQLIGNDNHHTSKEDDDDNNNNSTDLSVSTNTDSNNNNNSGTQKQQPKLYQPIKINVVVMKGINDDELYEFVITFYKKYGNKVQIRFIEYMPFIDNGWNTDTYMPYADMIHLIHKQQQQYTKTLAVEYDSQLTLLQNGSMPTPTTTFQLQPYRSPDPNDTTKWYSIVNDNETINSSATAAASSSSTQRYPNVGFITSMSEHFCDTCNRLRLTADGQIKVCLFDGGKDSTSTVQDSNDNAILTDMTSLRDIIRYSKLIQQEHDCSENDDTDSIKNNNNNNNNGIDLTSYYLNKVVYAAVQKKHAKLGGHVNPQHIMDDSTNNRPMTLIGG